MPYKIKAQPEGRGRRFDVWSGGRHVAEIEHDHRGDEFRLWAGGRWISCGRIVEGGGIFPLRLTSEGVRLLDEMLE